LELKDIVPVKGKLLITNVIPLEVTRKEPSVIERVATLSFNRYSKADVVYPGRGRPSKCIVEEHSIREPVHVSAEGVASYLIGETDVVAYIHT